MSNESNVVRALRHAPRYVMPLLVLSGFAAVVLLVFLVAYAVIAFAVLGAILALKDVGGAPAQYEKDPPLKAWDGLWAWCTVPDLPGAIRPGLLGAAGSTALIILAVWQASELSVQFAWGLLGATAVLGGVESYMRHHRVSFRAEAAWVTLDCLILGAVVLIRPHGWVLGVAAACAIELVGFVAGFCIATARVGENGDAPA